MATSDEIAKALVYLLEAEARRDWAPYWEKIGFDGEIEKAESEFSGKLGEFIRLIKE